MSDVVDADYRETTTLAVREPTPLAPQSFFSVMRPRDKVAFATEVADALKPILTAKKLTHKLGRGDDEYVELEGWQTCAAMCGMAAKVEWTRPLPEAKGFEARAIVVRIDTGIEVGAGESLCSRRESKWTNRDDFALKGMAQTRAQSRALRGVLAWILVLAGYKPTPAEEMPANEPPPPEPPQTPAPQWSSESVKERAKRLGIENLVEWAALRKCEWRQSVLHSELDNYEAELAAPAARTKAVKRPTAAQKKMYFALCGELHMDDKLRHAFNAIVTDKESFADFTFDEAHKAIDELNRRVLEQAQP